MKRALLGVMGRQALILLASLLMGFAIHLAIQPVALASVVAFVAGLVLGAFGMRWVLAPLNRWVDES